MIFDLRSITDITDAELKQLVDKHISERQHVEYKMTYELKKGDDKLELLKDVVSFANGGGGYILIGVRDDGKGSAQKFESLTEADVERIRRSILDSCQDHIDERIEAMEAVHRIIDGNHLVVVRIPDSSRKPHMVTFQNSTGFYYRNHDGKREMTLSQIKAAFRDDFNSRQLNTLISRVDDIAAQLSEVNVSPEMRSGLGESAALSGERLLQNRFEQFEAELEENG